MHVDPPVAEPSGADARRGLTLPRRARLYLAVAALLGLAGLGILVVLLHPVKSGEPVQAASALQPAALSIGSVPSGATVVLDDQPAGQTPVRFDRLSPGQHTVSLILAGYRAWQATVELAAADEEHRVAQLEPLPGSLEVTASAPGAAVTIDGASKGAAPLTLSAISPGVHQVRLELAGYRPWEGYVWVGPDQRKAVHAELARDELEERRPPEPARAVAIVVENAPDARPQSGLDRADVVYETLAERGITRFLALYLQGEAPVIGPVRSARHYFVGWAREYGAALVHIGASPQGYQALRAAGLANLDETYGDPGFWRSRARWAPHNAYTSTEAIGAALGEGAPSGSWAGLKFKEPTWQYPGEPVEQLTLDYGWGYQVAYTFSPARHLYLRNMAGAPHRDAETGQQLAAASVVIMRVPSRVIDAQGRLDLAMVGSGRADYFLDGVHLEGSWQRDSLAEPTVFLDDDGRPVHFNPGPTWIQVVPPEAQLQY